MAKIIYPKRIRMSPDLSKAKVRYLEHGFRLLGIDVGYDPTLSPKIITSEIYPVVLEYKKGKVVEILFDITASRFKVHEELFDDCDLYFKTHMSKTDGGGRRHEKMLPMPQSTSQIRYLNYVEQLRAQRRKGKFPIDLVAVFVNSDVDFRQRVVETIRSHKEWESRAWMIQHPKLERTEVPKELCGSKLKYYEHLKLQSDAKMCLALPGARKNQEASISFRHTEIWGMGGVVFTISPNTIEVGRPKKHTVNFRRDMKGFARKVNTYLNNADLREEVSQNGMDYFERFLRPERHAIHMLRNATEFCL